MRLDQRFGAVGDRQVGGIGGVQEPDRQRRVVGGERQPGGEQQPVAGDLAAGRDAPQRDLQRVLAAAGAVGLDAVGQFGLDATDPQRRQPASEHLAVERVRQAHRRPAARRHDRR